jgi:hypothetical protein
MAKKQNRYEQWMAAAKSASVFALLCVIAYLSAGYGYQKRSTLALQEVRQAYEYGQRDGALKCQRTSYRRLFSLKILHLDIETAPHKVYVWGLWKQNVAINQIVEPGYTLCWAAKWHGKSRVMFDSVHESKPKEMVKKVHALLDEADVVCHYNGTKFDIPTLNNEFLLFGLKPPSQYKEMDLLRTARGRFRFPSNKLDYIAQQLGLGSKTKHMGMDMWRDCMEGCDKAWSVMKKYNKQDVKLLEDLYLTLLPWIKNHPNWGLYLDPDRPTCRNCGSENVIKKGLERTTTVTYQRYKCNACGTPLRSRKRNKTTSDGVTV